MILEVQAMGMGSRGGLGYEGCVQLAQGGKIRFSDRLGLVVMMDLSDPGRRGGCCDES